MHTQTHPECCVMPQCCEGDVLADRLVWSLWLSDNRAPSRSNDAGVCVSGCACVCVSVCVSSSRLGHTNPNPETHLLLSTQKRHDRLQLAQGSSHQTPISLCRSPSLSAPLCRSPSLSAPLSFQLLRAFSSSELSAPPSFLFSHVTLTWYINMA